MAANGDSVSNMNLLFFPRWSRSWHSEPMNRANRWIDCEEQQKISKISFRRQSDVRSWFPYPATYFNRSKCVFAVLNHRIHCVCHRKAVRPIVIRYSSIVLFDGQRESCQTVLIESMQSKQIGEHVNCAFGLFEVVISERIEMVLIDIGHRFRYTAR